MAFFALLNVAGQAFCKLLEIVQTLAENIKAVDHKALLAANSSDKQTASHHQAECLALLVGKADLFFSVLIKCFSLRIRHSILLEELGQFSAQALDHVLFDTDCFQLLGSNLLLNIADFIVNLALSQHIA